MTKDSFEQIERTFQRLRRLAAAERAAALDEIGADDCELRREVESLLAAYDGSGDQSFLDTPVLGKAFPVAIGTATELPAQIGQYRIIEALGEGGMATVFVAEQERPRRRVALKVMKTLLGPRAEKRFELEALVLGRLRHPGIAQIYEAGIHQTATGRLPYIAMELVEGERLTEFVQRRRLDEAGRLRLFVRICDAVEHAHQRGVIHRDLKPSNILVEERDGRSMPKLLDLGIARATDVDIQATTMRTSVGELVGTIQYMSPEQAAGDPEDIDTRSDVYALGVILFELLSQRMPYDLRGKAIHEAVRTIREDDPLTLSAANPALRGDLEAIALKAMEKDKNRRYQSAREFADDIRRYLNNEPITARQPSAGYHLRKFARRNRTIVIGAACFVSALVVGLAGTIWFAVGKSRALRAESAALDRAVIAQQDAEQAQAIAERRFDEVRRLANIFIVELDGHIRSLPGSTEARNFVVSTGLEYLDRLAQEAGEDDELRMDVGAAYFRLGDILGYPDEANLGDREGAWAAYQKGLTLLESVHRSRPDDPSTQRNVALSYSHCAVVLELLGRQTESDEYSAKSLALIRSASAALPNNIELKADLAYHENRLGDVARSAQDMTAATQRYIAARKLYEEILGVDARSVLARRGIAAAHDRLGRLAEIEGRHADAVQEFTQFIETTGALLEGGVGGADIRLDLAVGYERLGVNHRALGDRVRALAAFERSLSIRDELLKADPRDMKAVEASRSSYCYLGEELLAAGRRDEALSRFEQYAVACQRVAEAEPNNGATLRELAVSHYKLAEYHLAVAKDAVGATQSEHQATARNQLVRCRAIFKRMQDRGMLSPNDGGVLAMLESEIKGCENLAAAQPDD